MARLVVDDSQVRVLLSPKEHLKAYKWAMSRIATKARSVARRTMSQTFRVPLKATKGIAIRKMQDGSVYLWGSNRTLDLVRDLKAKDLRPAGVTYGMGAKSYNIPNAFIPQTIGKVFVRAGQGRLPINRPEHVRGGEHAHSIGKMLTDNSTISAINTMLQTEAPKIVDAAMSRVAMQSAKRITKRM